MYPCESGFRYRLSEQASSIDIGCSPANAPTICPCNSNAGTQHRINISIQKQLTPRSAWLRLRYVNPCSVLTSQDRHEARYPNIGDFTTRLNSSVIFELVLAISLLLEKSSTKRCGYFVPEVLR